MKDVLYLTVAFAALAVFGLAVGSSMFYLSAGVGLHPAPAGVIALVAGVAILWATGEMGVEE